MLPFLSTVLGNLQQAFCEPFLQVSATKVRQAHIVAMHFWSKTIVYKSNDARPQGRLAQVMARGDAHLIIVHVPAETSRRVSLQGITRLMSSAHCWPTEDMSEMCLAMCAHAAVACELRPWSS